MPVRGCHLSVCAAGRLKKTFANSKRTCASVRCGKIDFESGGGLGIFREQEVGSRDF